MSRTLKDHEELCSIRHKNIEAKFDSIDQKIDKIQREIDGFKNFLLGLALKSFLGLFITICGAVFIIKL
jgi:hypothetical protein